MDYTAIAAGWPCTASLQRASNALRLSRLIW
jgi:hypothetical protein